MELIVPLSHSMINPRRGWRSGSYGRPEKQRWTLRARFGRQRVDDRRPQLSSQQLLLQFLGFNTRARMSKLSSKIITIVRQQIDDRDLPTRFEDSIGFAQRRRQVLDVRQNQQEHRGV